MRAVIKYQGARCVLADHTFLWTCEKEPLLEPLLNTLTLDGGMESTRRFMEKNHFDVILERMAEFIDFEIVAVDHFVADSPEEATDVDIPVAAS